MERALNLDQLRQAIGDGALLPTPRELQERLAQAEIALFFGPATIDDEVLATGWYLHGIASVQRSLELYPVDRQLRAHQVSAHIFDLAASGLAGGDLERRQLLFAAQLGYLRGGLAPNATALYKRRPTGHPNLREDPGEVALEVGSALLALDRRTLFPRLDALRAQAAHLQQIVGVEDLLQTPYGAAARVIEGCFELLVHLTYGGPERLGRAKALFEEAVHPPYAANDLDSRWVAAHLRDVADDLGTTSIWAHLPQSVPPTAARAMTLGDPAVMTLWPPQLELLAMSPSPLERDVRRMVMSFPTSAGKTLLAQYLIAAHIASGGGSVCVVVPTHSLGRELQRDLSSRLSILGSEVEDAGPLGVPLPTSGRVIVMTPEKFAAQVRNEPARMLSDFSLFLIDEAHHVGDRERGWTLESAIAFIHAATQDSAHRLILLSAALGNRIHFGAWLGQDGGDAVTFHHPWKGPRRAHALFGTVADWNAAEIVPPTRRGGVTRQVVPLRGAVHIRTGQDVHHSLTTTEPIAKLVRKSRDGLTWEKDLARSDRQYQIRARMATLLGAQGSVLIVEATKQSAQRTAQAVAEAVGERTLDTGALVALASARLGSAHPLIEPLRYGVGFHHSALPDDIQAELELGIRKGSLRYLVATTTLVEGINLPVRSVLIGERGYQTASGFVVTLDAPKLLNAIGRAGRAGRETEGWVVLSVTEAVSSTSFRPLMAEDEDLQAISALASPLALDTLAEYEQRQLAWEDAVLEAEGKPLSDFIAHVWFVANSLKESSRDHLSTASVALESTLAWQQLGAEDQVRWRRVLDAAVSEFERTPPERRARWARTGTSLKTASILESLAAEIRASIRPGEELADAVTAWMVLSEGDRLSRIHGLSERAFRGFRPRRNAPSGLSLDVDVRSLVADWLRGMDLGELGEKYLAAVADEQYRFEQLSEFVARDLEHFMPWIVGTLVEWVNDDGDDEERITSDLAAFIKHGVDSDIALEVALGGVRSRRLVHAISRKFPPEAADVREWLRESHIGGWRAGLDASPSELADLLFFTRVRDARIASRVLAGDAVELPVVAEDPVGVGPATLKIVDEEEPARVGVYQGERVCGFVGPQFHNEVRLLMAIGIPLTVALADGHVELRVVNPESSETWFA